ncbi:MAG: hypothetical protein IJW96_00575 [Clostridia bacterium]|nr:hypothetical protein [Clostridia bacterium]
MKRKQTKHVLLSAVLLGTMMFPFASCAAKEVASVSGRETLYQYQIDEIWLVADFGKKLETYTDCKELTYFSETRALDNMTFASPSSYIKDESWWGKEYFPEIELKAEEYGAYNWYSQKHHCYVDVLVTFEKVKTTYTPSYTIKNDLAEITFTEVQYPGTKLDICKNENILTYKEYEAFLQKKSREFAGVDVNSNEYENLVEKYEKQTKNMVVLKTQCMVVTAMALTVEYVPQ